MGSIDDGIGGDGPVTPAKALAISAFTSIALYNVLELTFIIFATFKRRSGLYFISFCVATWTIPLYSVGFLLKHLRLSSNATLYSTLLLVGWCGMITGQSFVLYSRLHLLDRNRARLRAVLVMIIIDAIILHVPIIVLVYGANGPNPDPWLRVYSVYEKIQITVFFVQELIISGLYIAATVRMFRFEGALRGRRPGKVLKHLIIVNVLIIALDITILGLEFAGAYDLQTSWKGLVYSVKLKLEFRILNSLIDITKGEKYGNSSAEQRDCFAGVQGSSKDKECRSVRSHPRRTESEQMTRMTGMQLEVFDGSMSSAARGKTRDARPITASYSASVHTGDAEEGCGSSGGNGDESSQEGIMVSRTTVVQTTVHEEEMISPATASKMRRHSEFGPGREHSRSTDFETKASSSSSDAGCAKSSC